MKTIRTISLTAGLMIAPAATAGVVTTDPAVQCATAQRSDGICDDIRVNPWSGKLELALGLDSALAIRKADEKTFRARLNISDGETSTLKNEGSETFRFGATARLEIFEYVGAAVTAGFETTSTDATPDTMAYTSSSGSYPFTLDYSGVYVESAMYFPIQRLNTRGIFGGIRRFLGKSAKATNSTYGQDANVYFTAEKPPVDLFLGGFFGPFYMTLVSRNEIWKQDNETSSVNNSGAGFEFGLSGPIAVMFPR